MNEEQRIRMKQKFADAGEQSALRKADVMRWVAVSERLPKIGEVTDVYISIGHRVTNYKWEDYDLQSSFMPHEITHWIPIPEPPCL
jgi:hypothetical protein